MDSKIVSNFTFIILEDELVNRFFEALQKFCEALGKKI